MKTLSIITLTLLMTFLATPNYLYNFNSSSKKDWVIVNDGVMGGLSNGMYQISEDGHGIFKGHVSLENNGGFTSLRNRQTFEEVSQYKKIILRIKGDGKKYQFRLKRSSYDNHSYIHYFETNEKWQEIEIKLSDFYASWRGRKLDMPNFESDVIQEMTFLIANYKEEDFQLEIDYIALK